MTLDELITRLEGAEGPDRWLDADVAIACGLIVEREWWSTDYLKFGLVPAYSASVDAAIALAERLLPGVEYEITNLYSHNRVTLQADEQAYGDHPCSMPIAIVIATLRGLDDLRALQSEEPRP